MIGALELVADHFALAKRSEAVGTTSADGMGNTLAVAEQRDGFFKEGTRYRCRGEIVGPAGDIPGIAKVARLCEVGVMAYHGLLPVGTSGSAAADLRRRRLTQSQRHEAGSEGEAGHDPQRGRKPRAVGG